MNIIRKWYAALGERLFKLRLLEHPPVEIVSKVHSKNLENRIKSIIELGEHYDWRLEKLDRDHFCLRFKKDGMIIDVWYTKMTVGTTLTHPKKGRSSLFRERVQPNLLAEIFRNPRVHTERGYYTR